MERRLFKIYFTIIAFIFLSPIAGHLLLPGAFNYDYIPPLLLIVGLYSSGRKSNTLKIPKGGLTLNIFYIWLFLSVSFIFLFYEHKLQNFLNTLGIVGIYVSVIHNLRYERWKIFLKAFFHFLFLFIFFNVIVQYLPFQLGEDIFSRVSGFSEKTTNFSYATLSQSVAFFPAQFPVAFPTYRNHGVSFLTTFCLVVCMSLIRFPKTLKSVRFNGTIISILTLICILYAFFSYSRTSLVAIALVIIFYLIISKKKSMPFSFALVAFVLIYVFVDLSSFQEFLSALFRINSDEFIKTGSGREVLWEFHARLFSLRPITGWGWVLPYEEYGYDLGRHSFSESGLTFTFVAQGLLRGMLFISLLILSILRNLPYAKQDFYHALSCCFCICLVCFFLFQGSLVGGTSAIGCISQAILAISLFSNRSKKILV